jgi:transposase-like protein
MDCLIKDREELLAYYDFPAEHWPHIRTTNPIESTFSTVRLRSDKTRSCGSRETTLTMMSKLLETAKKGWRRIKGSHLVKDVIAGVRFQDGERTSCD